MSVGSFYRTLKHHKEIYGNKKAPMGSLHLTGMATDLSWNNHLEDSLEKADRHIAKASRYESYREAIRNLNLYPGRFERLCCWLHLDYKNAGDALRETGGGGQCGICPVDRSAIEDYRRKVAGTP